MLDSTTFVGIDPTAGEHPFTYATLDRDGNLLLLAAGELEDVITYLGNLKSVYAAVNAPSRPNRGLVRNRLEKKRLTPAPLRGADMRLAEFELRARGIHIVGTPGRVELCPAWLQVGFGLYQKLEGLGFRAYPTARASHQWLETHPHAAFCTLLGQLPLPKPTLEGRLQRQLILHEQGLGIKNPMNFFEEITRYRLMKGIFPMECVYSSEELDALMAAFVAFLAGTKAERVTVIGAREEGQIVLPVEAS